MNKYPIIKLSLKGLEADNFEGYIYKLSNKLKYIIDINEEVLASKQILSNDYQTLVNIKNNKWTVEDIENFLSVMSSSLYKYHRQKCIILIDEYDNIMVNATENGYLDKVLQFYCSFLGEGLKINDSLQMGIITGILRLSKENIFSGLNNLKVKTILDEAYSDKFGFVEEEVECLMKVSGMQGNLETLKTWYNGYLFGTNVIYNPWSVLSYIESNGDLRPYWINTASNKLIENIIKAMA